MYIILVIIHPGLLRSVSILRLLSALSADLLITLDSGTENAMVKKSNLADFTLDGRALEQ